MRFRVWGLGFCVQGLGFGVSGRKCTRPAKSQCRMPDFCRYMEDFSEMIGALDAVNALGHKLEIPHVAHVPADISPYIDKVPGRLGIEVHQQCFSVVLETLNPKPPKP